MKIETFYRKYANIPVPKRHIVSAGTVAAGFKDSMSPWELYKEINHLDDVIARSKIRQEELLEIADHVIK